MNQAIRKLSGLLVLPVLLAALLMMPVRANAEEVPYECFAELPVSVELNGDHDEQFHVTIELAEGMDETTPLPDEAADGLLIAGDASDSFSNFHFTKPGDYVYVVKQEIGDTAYMSYDNTVYTVTIRVTNADNGGLQHEIWATTDDDPNTKVQELAFLNTYALPTPKRHLGRHAHAETGLHPAADQRRFAADRAGGGAGSGRGGHRGAGGAARAEKQAGRPAIIPFPN